MAQQPKQAAPCPICGKPAKAAYEPFCSKRCADVDLHRWMNDAYAIAGEPVDEESLSSLSGETGWGTAKH
ncbi:DNA gyrase inhibitor YacG [Rhodoblastus sp.]|uniref:DNA gyrase inhibitor YacG n=1 Tax=Rhodoblastus sp. TaxID=1962975 RepID=UPI003F9563A3